MLHVYEELGETSRRQILAELRTGPKNVTELVTATGLKQPNVSNHLCRMRQRSIVKANKVGRQVYYALASKEVESIVNSCFASGPCPQCHIDTKTLALDYAKAAVAGDEGTCLEVMDTAFRTHLPLLDIYQDILARAMGHVGEWYKAGEIDVAQEHIASYLTERMMARVSQILGPTRRHDLTAILGCAPNGWHVIGLRMIGDYLRQCGWQTLYLGANVPTNAFLAAVSQNRPRLVLLSCSADASVDDTVLLLRLLRNQRRTQAEYKIGIGGYCVDQDPDRFMGEGADFTSRDLREFASRHLPEVERTAKTTA